MSVKSLLADIGNAVRTVNNKTAKYNLNEIRDEILKFSGHNIPLFSYTGLYDSDVDSTGENWEIRLLTSGDLTFSKLYNAEGGIDIFCAGGGGGGGFGYLSALKEGGAGAGGGGGYTTTKMNFVPALNQKYTISIGSGGAGGNETDNDGCNGGTTSAFGISANGGIGGLGNGGAGGAGGSGGGANGANNGGSNGSNGVGSKGGIGQGTTTRAFADNANTLFCGGGGSGAFYNEGNQTTYGLGGDGGGANGGNYIGSSAFVNTGGGGGGGGNCHQSSNGGSGGSGIVIIRNKR